MATEKMKRISLIGLSLVLVLFMGTLASAAGTFNIDYVVDGLNIQGGSTELNFKGHTLRFGGSFDLNDKNFIEGNFITGKITTLLDKEGNPIDIQGVTILGPMSGNYLGWNFVLLGNNETRFFAGAGYFSRTTEFNISQETSEFLLKTVSESKLSGVVGKIGADFTFNDKMKLMASLAWGPSIKESSTTVITEYNKTSDELYIGTQSSEAKCSILDTLIALEYQLNERFSMRGGFTMMRLSFKESSSITKLGGFFLGAATQW